MALIIAVPRETETKETRVALTPSSLKPLLAAGFDITIEPAAGQAAHYADEAFVQAGARIAPDRATLFAQADVILAVNPPPLADIAQMKSEGVLISLMYAYTRPELVEVLLDKSITVFAMDAVPRISRAQKMDALSSQANLAGYKAVILGAAALGKIFPLLMTAAGTITPAKVLIFGAGVAGLQALATAKRLGAVVEVTDVRSETKEQVESLGGRFLTVEGEGVQTEGGYAKEVSEEYLRKQKAMIEKHVQEADLIITTAQVMGKKAPILVSEEMVKSMRPGAVIVDMAVSSGGNCALSEPGQTVQKHGITIIGEINLPALLPINASELYARNISTLLLHLGNGEGFQWDFEEEITGGSVITHQGEIKHRLTAEILGKA
ncbi:MAG: Re/Si-specific NAD(P)(+) transhydrogenase subunit alpha [Microscillaceae bacterium]